MITNIFYIWWKVNKAIDMVVYNSGINTEQ